LDLFRHHEDTTIVTCSCLACAKANALAAEACLKHRHKHPIGNILLDYEANLDNYMIRPRTQACCRDRHLPRNAHLSHEECG
jgi:hypothetical protein